MKKKVLYLSTLVALSMGMTSCIDNEEPDGLKDLRQGQAEKLRAEGELAKAQASKVKAEEALVAANAALINAQAAAQEVANQLAAVKVEEEKVTLAKMEVDLTIKKLEVAKAEAQSEADIQEIKVKLTKQKAELAKAEASLAEANAALEVAKMTAEETILVAQTSLNQAKQDAADAAEALKLAAEEQAKKFAIDAALLKDPATWAEYTKLGTARQNLVNKTTAYENAYVALVQAEKTLVNTADLAKKDSISQLNTKVQAVENKEFAVKQQEWAVVIAEQGVVTAEYAVTAAENTLKEFQDVTKKDMQAWAEELTKYQNSLKEISDKYDALNLEKTKLTEAKTAQLKPLEVAKAEADKAKTEAETALTEAKTDIYKDLDDYKAISKYYSFDITQALADEYFKTASVSEMTFNADNNKLETNNALSNGDLSVLENLLTQVDGQTWFANEVAQVKQNIAELKAQLADLKATSDADVKAWGEKLAAYNKAAIAYKWSEETGSSPLYVEVSQLASKYYYTYLTSEDASSVAAKFANYLELRKAFDGYENPTLEGYVKNYKTENFTSLRDYLYNNGTSAIGSSGKYLSGSWGAFTSASYKAFNNERYAEYSDEQIEEKVLPDMEKYGYSYGTWGKYIYAQYQIEKKETNLANQDDWNALYNTIAQILDDNDAAIAKINATIDVTKLNPFVEAVASAQDAVDAAQDAIDELDEKLQKAIDAKQNELDIVSVEKTEAENILYAVTGLVNAADVNGDVYYVNSTDKKATVDLYIAKAETQLKNNIDNKKTAVLTAQKNVLTAEQAVATAKAELETAKAELELFKAGKLTVNMSIENAKKTVANAQAAYDKAKAEYDEALKTVETILAAIKA